MKIIKLKPAYKDYIWGGSKLKENFNKVYEGDVLAESWELSCHTDGYSLISNEGYNNISLLEFIKINGNEVLGKNCSKFNDFPILIKFIDAKGDLSIQVHPDDSYALENENSYGKTEVWYILDCEDEAFIYFGFSKEISKDEFKKRIENDTLLEVLKKVKVKKGDVFFIEAGVIHAIGRGITLAEIQQNSNLTYRVYDYGRTDKEGNKRELHVEKAIEVTKREIAKIIEFENQHIAKCEYFTVDKIVLDEAKTTSFLGIVDEKSFLHVLVVEGSGKIVCDSESFEFKKGDSLFIPANSGEYKITGICEVLLTYID